MIKIRIVTVTLGLHPNFKGKSVGRMRQQVNNDSILNLLDRQIVQIHAHDEVSVCDANLSFF